MLGHRTRRATRAWRGPQREGGGGVRRADRSAEEVGSIPVGGVDERVPREPRDVEKIATKSVGKQ